MSILSSYVALKNCSLCILKREGEGEGSIGRSRSSYRGRSKGKDGYECLRKEELVTVLSVKELSTPVRAVYDSGEHFLVEYICFPLAHLISSTMHHTSLFLIHFLLHLIHHPVTASKQSQTRAIPHQMSPLISDALKVM